MMSDENPNIQVEITDAREMHCFRLVLNARAAEDDPTRHPVEIMLHARSLVDLIHKCSLALCDWQARTTEYLIERAVRDADIAPAPKGPAEPTKLWTAAKGAWHLCQSLLAIREGATDELIQECADALEDAMQEAD